MKILIVKTGALGDVVRTSYFAGALRNKYGPQLELCWLTSEAAYSILEQNRHINRLSISFDDFKNDVFDFIYSLDDEMHLVAAACNLKTRKFVGAIFVDGILTYTEDSSLWFDMGLLSKLGKEKADELKKSNELSHSEIFKKIFNVTKVNPEFTLSLDSIYSTKFLLNEVNSLVGINPYAGGRWPSKELKDEELISLLLKISHGNVFPVPVTVILFGAGEDFLRNKHLVEKIKNSLNSQKIIVANTDSSVMLLASFISHLKLLITSDSLAMHLAISQGVKTLAFFAPTSASEIDSFGVCDKILSTSPDYCSYRKDCDNSTITADRIIKKISDLSLF